MLTVTGSRLVSALVKQAHSPSAEKTLFLQRSSLHFPFILYLLVTVYLCCVFSTGKSNMRIFSYKYTLETMAVLRVCCSLEAFVSFCVKRLTEAQITASTPALSCLQVLFLLALFLFLWWEERLLKEERSNLAPSRGVSVHSVQVLWLLPAVQRLTVRRVRLTGHSTFPSLSF